MSMRLAAKYFPELMSNINLLYFLALSSLALRLLFLFLPYTRS